MEFPPVSNLVRATFDDVNQKNPTNSPPTTTVKAPQPVANASGIGNESDTLGVNSAAKSGTNRVGTVLDVIA